jgi:hypothetical protein
MNDSLTDPGQKCKKKRSRFSLECMCMEVSLNHLLNLFDVIEMAAGLFDLDCEVGDQGSQNMRVASSYIED